MTQFGGIRTKCPILGFMIRKTLVQTMWPGPGLNTPSPQEQLSIFIELCGHRASAMHAIDYQRNWTKV